jgi:hypothetical protein
MAAHKKFGFNGKTGDNRASDVKFISDSSD